MTKNFYFKKILLGFTMLTVLCLLSACRSNPNDSPTFLNIGEFSVKKISENCREVRDGSGRTFVLVPRGQKPPAGYEKQQIIEVPVQRIVVYSGYDAAMLKALGVLKDVLVGVTSKKEEWTIPEIREGMEKGRITYVGEPESIDYERLKVIGPELVLTWDQGAIHMMNEMDIPCVITTTNDAMDLDTRMRFAEFLAFFFSKEAATIADAFVSRVSKTVDRISNITSSVEKNPRVMWGDIYEKRVMVEPGNSWVAEIVRLSGGEYVFDDVAGAS